MIDPAVRLRPFTPSDQPAVRRLILTGLGDHFGAIDESLNPDLDDIAASYLDTGQVVVVAELAETIVGTGMLVREEPGVGRLVRMSVSSSHRLRGVGRALVAHLVEIAHARGDRRVVLETNDDWHDAIGLYRSCGFVEVGRGGGDLHLALDLVPNRPSQNRTPTQGAPSPTARHDG